MMVTAYPAATLEGPRPWTSNRAEQQADRPGYASFEADFRESQMWSISRRRSVLFGLDRFGRMRTPP